MGGSEKEINGKNLLLVAMMKKLGAFVEPAQLWLWGDLYDQFEEVNTGKMLSGDKKFQHTLLFTLSTHRISFSQW